MRVVQVKSGPVAEPVDTAVAADMATAEVEDKHRIHTVEVVRSQGVDNRHNRMACEVVLLVLLVP